MTSPPAVPRALAELRDELLALEEPDRLALLVEIGEELPEVPARIRESPAALERVSECQSPVFIAVEADGAGAVVLHAVAPASAPTTRGFASLLAQGVAGASPAEVLAIPADFPRTLGLDRAVSPLRIAGMTGLLARTQRQVRAAFRP
ncbi:SufE family protein [Microbacterium sp. ZXX196]|uniref:SufE family protein n=1 Tax=Microbacterium sp. ZXX196 TaxID=2609291 RepID=UPI0012B8FEEE|nr:SufE family protein [Microbacterium sp. ZXX196]MTE24075.1 cysteine desulfuration protein SufE [Microbacterium sp. ZXX196]